MMVYISMLAVGFIELMLLGLVFSSLGLKMKIEGLFTLILSFGIGWFTFKLLGYV